jgi:cob(I)alamin adenosyltransferase
MQRYVQVYTGDGKGKTTAAIGLTVRAVGAGLRVYFGQFMKKYDYSEIIGLRKLGDQVCVAQFGSGCYVFGNPTPQDVEAAQAGLTAVRAALCSGEYDLVIADEANIACACGVIAEAEILGLIAERPANVELVLTGRGAPPSVMAAADLVTEMRAVKHYYQNGVKARKGIES